MRKALLLLLFALSGSLAFSQISKKEAQENKILSVSEWETDLKTRKAKPVQESYTKFDLAGNVVEVMERNNLGELTLHEKYEYDAAGNKTVEIQLEPDGSIKKRHVYSYENNLRKDRKTYNAAGQLIAEKKYVYEFHKK